MLATATPRKWRILIGSASVAAAVATIIVIATSSSPTVRTSSSSTGGTAFTGGVPVNTASPTITGFTTAKSELYATTGSWRGRPTNYTYQWQDCNSSGKSCTTATGAASGPCSPSTNCYVVTRGEASAGVRIKVTVTATNSHGVSSPAAAAPVRRASTSEPVPCALTHAAGYDGTNSCWATHTGVTGATGFSEAEIRAGRSTLRHLTGDVAITTPNTVIDHAWISGCVAIDTGANNVTIRDSLITPNGDTCAGNAGDAPASAINDGQGPAPTGLLIEDTTVDGDNAVGDQYGVSLTHGACLRCNVFGFAKNFWSGTNTAAAPALFQDSYSHDLSANSYKGTTPPLTSCAHDNGWFIDSASYVTIEHSYSILTGAGYCVTGAITALADYGPPTHDTVDSSYMEGITGKDLAWGCGSTHSTVTNNAFSSSNGYGGTDYVDRFNANIPGQVWTGNYVAESPGEAAPPPSGDPGSDGC